MRSGSKRRLVVLFGMAPWILAVWNGLVPAAWSPLARAHGVYVGSPEALQQAIETAHARISEREAMAGLPAPERGALAQQHANLEVVRSLVAAGIANASDPVGHALASAGAAIDSREELIGTYLHASHMTSPLAAARANVEDARSFLDLLEGTTSGLAKAAALAKAGGSRQERLLEVQIPEPTIATRELPSEALRALLQVNGLEPTAQDEAGMARLDALPGTLRARLATLVEIFLAFDDASRRDDQGRMLAERAALLDAVVALAEAAAPGVCDRIDLPADPTLPGIATIAIGDCADTYTRDFALSVDLGGSDVYRNNAGGNGFGADPCAQTSPHPAAALVDLAGDDDYVSGRACGVNGGAIGGGALLVDAGGNDEYTAQNLGTNGGGHAGLGLLVDAGGNDVYTASGQWATNGGGFFGAGFLVDLAGDDTYTGSLAGTNGGGLLGHGLLLDGDGADAYTGFTSCVNGGASDGTGFLLDAGGDGDLYYAEDTGSYEETFGKNGGAGRGGVAFLLDTGGNDRYVGGSNGANGGGQWGTGFLVDAGGDDEYTAGNDGVNGSGWALIPGSHVVRPVENVVGLGFLIEVSGTDRYTAGQFGANGGCYVGSSFLYDGEGNDVFVTQDGGGVNGGAGGHNTAGCAAFFLNVDGDDEYRVTGGIEFEGGHGANGGTGGNGGAGFVFDTGGNDLYSAHSRGVNGGGWGGAGLLLDMAGNDLYQAAGGGVNGGAYTGSSVGSHAGNPVAGVGFLFDFGGDDRYTAGGQGANGGIDTAGVLTDVAGGLLLDKSGNDYYQDLQGGTGWNRTVVAKGGVTGQQFDF